MRKITFKKPGDTIKIGGERIGSWNITPEKYDQLIAIAPSHADLFDVTEDTDDDGKAEDKPARRTGRGKDAADTKE